MKFSKSLLLPFILALLTTGCTSTYIKNDFSSDAAFYKQINENSGSADIITKNDSVICLDEPNIAGDSIRWETANHRFIFDSSSGSAEKHSVALKEIKAVTFTHHWGNNIWTGIYSGAITGAVLTGALLQVDVGGGHSGSDPNVLYSAVPGALAGIILGGIVGIITGEDDLYILDNSRPDLKLDGRNSRHKFGLKIGRHSGFSNNLIPQKFHNADFTKLRGSRIPGIMATMYYNYPFSQLFSLNSELSFASSGSRAQLAVRLPTKAPSRDLLSSYETSSDEYVKVLELAAAARLNLFRSKITPYILLGPRFDILFPDESGIKNFLANLKNSVDTQGIGLSSEYNAITFGVTLGGGFSTGKMLPVELLVEARYNFDFTPRFEMHYDIPADAPLNLKMVTLYYADPGNQLMKYRSSDFQLTIGAAIF